MICNQLSPPPCWALGRMQVYGTSAFTVQTLKLLPLFMHLLVPLFLAGTGHLPQAATIMIPALLHS